MFAEHDSQGYRSLRDGIEMKPLVHGERTLMVAYRLHQGHELARHSHPHEQTGYLVSGHMHLQIGETVYDVNPGDSWSIPGGTEHRADILETCIAIEVFSPVREEYMFFD